MRGRLKLQYAEVPPCKPWGRLLSKEGHTYKCIPFNMLILQSDKYSSKKMRVYVSLLLSDL